MNELTNYVIRYYPYLMTPTEAAANSTIFWSGYADAFDSPARQRMNRKRLLSSDPDVQQLLADGPDDCLHNIRNRILRDNADTVFLNYCPRCQGLARTPPPRARPALLLFVA